MACYHMNVISVTPGGMIRKDGKIGDHVNRIIFSNSAEFKGYEFYQKMNEILKERGEKDRYKFIPCGKCIGCRAEERKNWAIRIELESKKYEHNYFFTLTYDDEHLPIPEAWTHPKTGEIFVNDGSWTGTLDKKDLSRFMHSLRTYWKREYDHDGVKFYACGEYGSSLKTERPHYHIIMMNCPEIKDLKVIGKNKKTGDAWYTSDRIAKIWGKGFIQIGNVSWNSISYTAGYTMKKLFGEVKDDYYAQKGKLPIFAQMSRKPGIGKEYFNQKGMDIYDFDEILNSKGQGIKPPRYFDKLAEQVNYDHIKAIKRNRTWKGENKTKLKMLQTNLTMAEQMKIDEEIALKKQKLYKRERINENLY